MHTHPRTYISQLQDYYLTTDDPLGQTPVNPKLSTSVVPSRTPAAVGLDFQTGALAHQVSFAGDTTDY